MEEMTRGYGDNSGASPSEVVRDQIASLLKAPVIGNPPISYQDRAAALIASAGRVNITDNDSIGRASDLIGMIVKLTESVEQRMQEAVQPHTDAVNAARGARDRFAAPLHEAGATVRAKIDAFRAEQREKAKAAQRAQQEDENARRAALNQKAAPIVEAPVKLAPVVGDYGTRVGDRAVKTFTIPDPRKVDIDILKHPKVQAAMLAACKDLAKVKSKIKGVVITDGAATTLRK